MQHSIRRALCDTEFKLWEETFIQGKSKGLVLFKLSHEVTEFNTAALSSPSGKPLSNMSSSFINGKA